MEMTEMTIERASKLQALVLAMVVQATTIHVCILCGRDLFSGQPFSAHDADDTCLLRKCADYFEYDPVDPIAVH